MNNERPQSGDNARRGEYESAINVGLALPFGFLLRLMLDNIGVGLSLALGFGGLANALQEYKSEKKGSVMAIAIWILALAIVIGLWIWL